MSLVHGELRKLLGLPTAWIGLILGLLAAPALVVLNAPAARQAVADGLTPDASDIGFQYLGIGMLGAMILGVVTVSSEYTPTGDDTPGARQLSATLLAAPRRARLVIAKGVALSLVTGVQGAITAVVTLVLTQHVHGSLVPAPELIRVVAAVLYWVLIGLLAYAITLIARNGMVTLAVLIVNSAVVSLSYLLTKVTPWAAYLPDIVGAHMFLRSIDVPVEIGPVTAGVVMTTWVAGLLAVAVVLFRWRDA
ncbi:ABC transporter permease [Actinoplanes sp. OR16]|uniref:ABC transporter permease n=1 Tax=Actinoplanes sp. OR16 TaxID=946334 RepID=UPI000FDCA74C|nr:ABC transporter permease [Actinoplanes sp. OR16]